MSCSQGHQLYRWWCIHVEMPGHCDMAAAMLAYYQILEKLALTAIGEAATLVRRATLLGNIGTAAMVG